MLILIAFKTICTQQQGVTPAAAQAVCYRCGARFTSQSRVQISSRWIPCSQRHATLAAETNYTSCSTESSDAPTFEQDSICFSAAISSSPLLFSSETCSITTGPSNVLNLSWSIHCDAAGPPAQPLLVHKAAAYVTRILSVFGISKAAPDQIGFGGEAAASTASGQDTAKYLDAFAAFRDSIRGLAKAKADPGQILAACDRSVAIPNHSTCCDCSVVTILVIVVAVAIGIAAVVVMVVGDVVSVVVVVVSMT